MAKKRKRFLGRMQMKLFWITVVLSIAFLALVIRIWYINKKDGKRYEKIVLAQQSYDSIEIPYRRGDILDRNGTQLATSEKVYNLIIEPKNILQDDKVKKATISALTKYFDITEQEIDDALSDKSSLYKKMLKKLSYDQVKPFNEFIATKDGKNVKGVWFEDEYQRYYPYGSLACHAIGFTVSGNVGQGGVEGYYSDELNGTDGREYGYLTQDMTLERTTKPPVNGYNIISTIDANAQSIVEKKINAFMTETGAKNVSALVMDPNSGEILAMANSNSFDLNEPYEDSAIAYQFNSEDGDVSSQIKALSEDERLDCLNKAWRNFIISDGFEPGSTYKTFTISGAIEDGALKGDETFFCGGNLKVADTTINCHNHSGHGQVNIEQSLMQSCNVALMQIAETEGRKTFAKYQEVFGFGKTTHVDLAGEAAGLVYPEEKLNPVELATSSFGQGLTVTMMQIGTAFCSVINGGNYYEPHMVKQIVDENGGIINNIEPTILRKTISSETSEFMRNALFEVVSNGTARKAQVAGYTIGGKTGTAEKLPRGNGKYLLSFIGFAPVENPQVVVYVTVDEPNVEDQASSGLGTIIAQSILQELLPYMNIYQSDSENKSEGADVGDQVATPIFDGAAPTEQLSEDLQNSTEEGSSENATEASTEVGTDSNTTEATTENTTQATTQAPAAQ
ncbi:penicillin-binding protein transpeptidase domain protein [Clostridium sp. CAG:590]|nr:penicillin-binding protein transpeptidase domain protein [Clostridium sp. CAG:590]